MDTRAAVYLVRHAQAAGSDTDDPPLSEEGRDQAAALGARLAHLGAVDVLHGPRRRAEQTARLLAAPLADAQVRVSELLDDRTPVPAPDRLHEYPAKLREWFADVPADEQDVDGHEITRAARHLAAMARRARGPVVAVTHSFVISWLVCGTLDAPVPAWLTLTPANAGLTVLECDDSDGLRLAVYNDTAHLETAHPSTAHPDTAHLRPS